jgi:hypothetical protein
MSKIQHALELANIGFHIFPLLENSKIALIKGYPTRATRDPEAIKNWWTDSVMGMEKNWNIGISTSRFGDDEALIVIDVDVKGDKKGDETLEALEMFDKEVPKTSTQYTPSGGRHLIYRHKEALKHGVQNLGDGLDTRSKGGYIVGCGSTLDNGIYRGDFLPTPTQAPEWLVETLGKAKEKSTAEAPKNINQEAAKDRAIHYLENEAPKAFSGGRNQAGYSAACRVKDFGVDEIDCLALMIEHWQCEPMIDSDELEHVVSSAYQYGTEVVGADAPEAAFTAVEPTAEEKLHYLEQINKDHALIYMEGSHFILHETVDEKGAPKRVFMNEQSFKRKFSPFSLQKRGTYATEWLDWPKRREFSGVCFTPEREPRNGYYNLWRGFTCTPLAYELGTEEQRKGVDMFLHHARENVCGGDEQLYRWLIGYFAHMVQRPYERPLTTLVFRGSKGVGKNALVDRVGNLLGDTHYVVAHNGRYLTSNFNGHLDSCLCLVLDEAIWSGDKSAEGVLKGVTTAPTILIERKGKEPYKVDNLVRLIVIGNEDWLVPASTDERRYAVMDVGEGNKQDGKFFHDMRVIIEERGGNRLLLDYLKKYDLKDIDVNKAPQTAALLSQKTSSLEPFENWWFNSLKNGRLLNSDFGDEWPETVDTHTFRSAFARTIKEMNIRSRLPDEVSMGVRLKKMAPGMTKTKRRDGDRTVWVYKFLTLSEARHEWDKFIGQEGLWE